MSLSNSAGEARTIIAHGGETIVPAGGGEVPHVHVNIDRRSDLSKLIDVRVQHVTRGQSRTAMTGARLPGGAGDR